MATLVSNEPVSFDDWGILYPIFDSALAFIGNATGFAAVKDDGTRISVTGSNLEYGSDGVPEGGVIHSIVIESWTGSEFREELRITGLEVEVDALQSALFVSQPITAVADLLFAGNDTIVGSSQNDVLWGRDGRDLIKGRGGDDAISGDSGRDVLKGGAGDDSLSGGDGRDILDGGKGSDRLTGGAGIDTFVFSAGPESGVDTIVDWEAGEKIHLNGNKFKGIGPDGKLKAKYFHEGSGAHDADDRIIYNKANGKLFYDANGDKAGGKVLFALIEKNTSLDHGDFVVI